MGACKAGLPIAAIELACMALVILLTACGDEIQPTPTDAGPTVSPGADAESTRSPVPTSTQIVGPTPTGQPGPIIEPTPTVDDVPTPITSPTPEPAATPSSPATSQTLAAVVEPCAGSPEACKLRNVDEINLFPGNVGAMGAAAHSSHRDGPTVEEILEGKDDSGLSGPPVHMAFRGTASWDSVRCTWNGHAMTAAQRKEAVHFWLGFDEQKPLPPAVELERVFMGYLSGTSPQHLPKLAADFGVLWRGGFTDESLRLGCYVEYAVHEYVLGTGPRAVIVAYPRYDVVPSWEVHRQTLELSQESLGMPQDRESYAEHLQTTADSGEESLREIIGDRESVVFLAPQSSTGSVTIEVWQAVAQWDLQSTDGSSVDAVRYGTRETDPEYRQTFEQLRQRTKEAGATDEFAEDRIPTIEGLRGHYQEIGAYDVIGPYNVPPGQRSPFVPSAPPPPRTVREPPDPVAGSTPYIGQTFASVSSGRDLTCGLEADGTAVCWGGAIQERISPSEREVFLSVSAGGNHACGIRLDRSIGCWGENHNRQSSPPHGNYKTINSGWKHTCALRDDDTPVCWGSNEHGQASPPEGAQLTTISSGPTHTCGLMKDGTPICWGYDYDGRSTPDPDAIFTQISVGAHHSCGLRGDGKPTCWGSNLRGQSIPPPDGRFADLSARGWHTCGLRDDGAAECWGDESQGVSTPPAGERFVSMSSGASHTCGLRQDGTTLCWGDNTYGKASGPGVEPYLRISAGWRHSCALRRDGSPVCWGDGDYGATTPPAGEIFTSLTSMRLFTCGLRPDRTAACWGGDKQSGPAPRATCEQIRHHICRSRPCMWT